MSKGAVHWEKPHTKSMQVKAMHDIVPSVWSVLLMQALYVVCIAVCIVVMWYVLFMFMQGMTPLGISKEEDNTLSDCIEVWSLIRQCWQCKLWTHYHSKCFQCLENLLDAVCVKMRVGVLAESQRFRCHYDILTWCQIRFYSFCLKYLL